MQKNALCEPLGIPWFCLAYHATFSKDVLVLCAFKLWSNDNDSVRQKYSLVKKNSKEIYLNIMIMINTDGQTVSTRYLLPSW